MPWYKMDGKKDGKQKYRVRINYLDSMGQAKQVDRVAYGLEEAKELERKLNLSIKEESPTKKMTLRELFEEYSNVKKHEIRETSLDKSEQILRTNRITKKIPITEAVTILISFKISSISTVS